MRRLLPFLAFALLLAGCGGAQTVSPTAETVVGSVPSATTTAQAVQGDAAAGDANSRARWGRVSGHRRTPPRACHRPPFGQCHGQIRVPDGLDDAHVLLGDRLAGVEH